jgi:hypothetical protein
MINTAIIALPHSEPVLGSNTPYLQIGFALPFLLFHSKFLTFADKTVDFLGSTIPVPTFYDSTLPRAAHPSRASREIRNRIVKNVKMNNFEMQHDAV